MEGKEQKQKTFKGMFKGIVKTGKKVAFSAALMFKTPKIKFTEKKENSKTILQSEKCNTCQQQQQQQQQVQVEEYLAYMFEPREESTVKFDKLSLFGELCLLMNACFVVFIEMLDLLVSATLNSVENRVKVSVKSICEKCPRITLFLWTLWLVYMVVTFALKLYLMCSSQMQYVILWN